MKPMKLIQARLCLAAAGLVLCQLPLRAVDFHVATAQDLQNALTLAAANGADDNIYLTNGYYVGNFNFNSTEARNITLLPEPGLTNTGITIDGAGTGRSMNLSCSADANLTVRGLTFLRNCGSASNAGLRVGTGGGGTVLVDGCRFISPTNTSCMGLEIVSGLNATVVGCTAAGAVVPFIVNSVANGISVSGLTGTLTVQNCTVTTNIGSGLSVASGSIVAITGNTFSGNSSTSYSGGSGVTCSGTTVTISGNTFIGNSTTFFAGGGAYCSGTTVTISNNNFTGNSGYSFGGASCSGTTIMLSGNTFTGNSASGYYYSDPAGSGGGASCSGTTITLSGNTFTGNSATGNGGGTSCSGTTVTLSGNTFTGNSAATSYGGTSCGGGTSCYGYTGSTMTLTNNTFIGNSAGSGIGGGAYCKTDYGNSTIILSGNTARLNTAGSGGGLYLVSSTVSLLDNLVINNAQSSSSSKGGGVWVNAYTNLDMINNTVFGNTAQGNGGGVAFQVDSVTEILNVFNNIIWGNTASGNGADVHLAGTGQSKTFRFNDAHDMYGVWDIAVNNLDVSPQFFDPVNGDYHIQSTSPCKDTGTNGAP